MQQFAVEFVTKRLARLRVYLLIVLCFIAIGLGHSPDAPVQAGAAALSGLTVAIDPGHGGYDGGARAVDSGVWEKELTLRISNAIEKELTARGATVILTRTRDECLSDEGSGKMRKRADLQARLDTAEAAGADVFLSIHLNEYRDRAESGPQVFYQRGADEGRLLAGALQQALIEHLQPQRVREANAGDYYVLRSTAMPAALVECGFLSNPQEEEKLLDSVYHQRIARAVAGGLESWLTLRARVGENGV